MKVPTLLEQLGLSLTRYTEGKPHKNEDAHEQKAGECSNLRQLQQSQHQKIKKYMNEQQQVLTETPHHQLKHQGWETLTQHSDATVSCKIVNKSQVQRNLTGAQPGGTSTPGVPGSCSERYWQLQDNQQAAMAHHEYQQPAAQFCRRQQQALGKTLHPTLQLQETQQERQLDGSKFPPGPWQHAYNHALMREFSANGYPIERLQCTAADRFTGAVFLIKSYKSSKEELVTFWQYQLQPPWFVRCLQGEFEKWQLQQQQCQQQDTAALCKMLVQKGERVVQHADGLVSFKLVLPQHGSCGQQATMPRVSPATGDRLRQDQLRHPIVAEWVKGSELFQQLTAAAAAAAATGAAEEIGQQRAAAWLKEQNSVVRQRVELKHRERQQHSAQQQWENMREAQLLESGWVPLTLEVISERCREESAAGQSGCGNRPHYPTLSQLLQRRQNLPRKQQLRQQLAKEREQENQTVLIWEPYIGAANIKRLPVSDCRLE